MTEPDGGPYVAVPVEALRLVVSRYCQGDTSVDAASELAVDELLVAMSRWDWDREVLVEVLVYHGQRSTDGGCHCGWAKLGESHAGHVADVYEASIAARAR